MHDKKHIIKLNCRKPSIKEKGNTKRWRVPELQVFVAKSMNENTNSTYYCRLIEIVLYFVSIRWKKFQLFFCFLYFWLLINLFEHKIHWNSTFLLAPMRNFA